MLLERVLELLRKTVHVLRYEGSAVALGKAKKKLGVAPEASFSAALRAICGKAGGRLNPSAEPVSVRHMLQNRSRDLQPIAHIVVPAQRGRLNVVTDSVNEESLFGGVATAVVLAVLFARQKDMDLRIITRKSVTQPKHLNAFLDFYQLAQPAKVEYYSDCNRDLSPLSLKLEVTDQDIFLATSWWTAQAVNQVCRRSRFFYVLQEVEPFFYPHGDERLRCEQTLAGTNIDFLINSRLLQEYYIQEEQENIIRNSIAFEPAFPRHIYSPGASSFDEKRKYRLFFYGRPHNPRNLFYTGLQYLEDAVASGIIDKDRWEIVIAGADVPAFSFSGGVKPVVRGRMTWPEYAEFAKTVDLAFCLMYTPHPSYPPLDMAASGAVVLTNRYLNKTRLDYSPNIILADLDENSMRQGFLAAVELAQNMPQRKTNFTGNRIEISWEKTLAETLGYMTDRVERG